MAELYELYGVVSVEVDIEPKDESPITYEPPTFIFTTPAGITTKDAGTLNLALLNIKIQLLYFLEMSLYKIYHMNMVSRIYPILVFVKKKY